ncbi:FAD-binding oxidoreductase [Alphaproteobacteria bacterium]|nr:FAD-binding oxidoreductase [Alphaproteobacteria bacterium]
MSKQLEYDWIIVGGGVAGISIAEILARNGLRVLLLEKEPYLGSKLTGVFQEWFHTGLLYSIQNDSHFTSKYLLGAIDDMFSYYSEYTNMNIKPGFRGFTVDKQGWFIDNPMIYSFYKDKFNLKWNYKITKALWFANQIKNYDFIRRRIGDLSFLYKFNLKDLINSYPSFSEEKKTVKSNDYGINSRKLLHDLLLTIKINNGKIKTSTDVKSIEKFNGIVKVSTDKNVYYSKKLVICAAGGINSFSKYKVRKHFAPILVLKGLKKNTKSFVHLHSNPYKSINLTKTSDDIGLGGGISFSDKEKVMPYINYSVNLHKKINSDIKLIDFYIPEKEELIVENEDRNYQFHIKNLSENIYGVVLGKFTLMFSLAPEFYRRIYGINSSMNIQNTKQTKNINKLLSKLEWEKIYLKKVKKNGYD